MNMSPKFRSFDSPERRAPMTLPKATMNILCMIGFG